MRKHFKVLECPSEKYLSCVEGQMTNHDASENDVDKRKWSELSKCEKFDVESKKTNLIESKKNISNQYNFKLYEWFFLLNAGGLIGSVTLVTVETKDPNYIILCVIMAGFFIFGILSIVFANLTERERFRSEAVRISNVYENDFKQDQISRDNCIKSMNSDGHDVKTTKIIETLSIVFFIFGIVVGAVYLAIKSDDMCSIPCKCPAEENHTPNKQGPSPH